jgi:hypothetical protein
MIVRKSKVDALVRVCDKNVGAIFLTETYPPFGKGGQGGFAIKA